MKAAILFSCALVLCACSRQPDASTDTTAAVSAATPASAPAVGATTSTTSSGEVQQATGLTDPNSATEAQLVAAGMTDVAAKAVIAKRQYANMEAVDSVLAGQNLTLEQRKAIYAKIWKPIALNSATDAEIQLIPGVGRRMLREFKEYRPYTSMEQFRREIGKYVDKAELERLAMYVAVK